MTANLRTLLLGAWVLGHALAQAAAPAAATPAAAASKPAAAYAGHGATSVSTDVVRKFAATPIPTEISSRIQQALDVRAPGAGEISPDGKRMFFTWNVTGTTQIWRLDGPQHFPVQLTGGEDTTTLADVAPNGEYLLVSRDRNGEENPGLYWMSPEGGALHVIQHKHGVQTLPDLVSDDSRYVYFHANDVKENAYALYRWDRSTGKIDTLLTEPGLWMVADRRADGHLLLAKEVGGNMTEFWELAPGEGQKPTPVIGVGEREEYDVRYAAKAGELLVLTPKLGQWRRLYRCDGKTLTPVSPDVAMDLARFELDRPRSRIYLTYNDKGYAKPRVFDAKTYKELTLPKLPTADLINAGAMSADGSHVSFSVDPGNGPRQSYVLDWKTKKLIQWNTTSVPEMDISHATRASLESYPARDGTSVPMFVWRSQKCQTELCPVIVDFHGGPEAQSLAGWSALTQVVVDDGFVYVRPNVRGSDGYGKDWIHADDGAKRLNVVTDIEDCSKFIRSKWAKNGQVPKVGIFGGSYGGYSSLMGMTYFAGAYDAGVEIVGISNLVTFLQNTAPYRRALRVSEYGDVEKDRAALVKLSPITYVDRVKAPMLLIQGVSDPRVPVGEAIQIHEALDAKKIPNQLILFPDEGHGAKKRGNIAVQYGASLQFFEKYLKTTAKPSPATN